MIPTTENLQAWTLHQPYASGIALGDPGNALGAWKDIENRPQRRTIPEGGRWYGLHAGLVWSEPDRPSAWHRRLRLEAVERAGRDQRPRDPNTSTLPHPLRPTLPKGAMLGVFHVTACVRYPGRAAGPALLEETDPHKLHGNDAAFGPWCYLIDEVLLLPEPVPCRGMQGSWPVAKVAGLELAQRLVDLVTRSRERTPRRSHVDAEPIEDPFYMLGRLCEEAGLRVTFGLKPGDRVRVADLLSAGETWPAIAKVIGWDERTLREYFEFGNPIEDANGRWIMNAVREGKSWDAIEERIGWDKALLKEWYERHFCDMSTKETCATRSTWYPVSLNLCAEPLDGMPRSRRASTPEIQQNCTYGFYDAE